MFFFWQIHLSYLIKKNNTKSINVIIQLLCVRKHILTKIGSIFPTRLLFHNNVTCFRTTTKIFKSKFVNILCKAILKITQFVKS